VPDVLVGWLIVCSLMQGVKTTKATRGLIQTLILMGDWRSKADASTLRKLRQGY